MKSTKLRSAAAGALGVLALAAPAAHGATTEVGPADLSTDAASTGFYVPAQTGTRTPGALDLTSGPGSAPYGTGSAQIGTSISSDKVTIWNQSSTVTGKLVSQIDALGYSAYRHARSTSLAHHQPALNMEVDFNGAATGGFATLVYEPVYQSGGADAVKTGEWQTWDAYDGGQGKWWTTRAIGSGCASDCFVTWDALKAQMTSDAFVYRFGVNQGSGQQGTVSSVDGLTFGAGGESTTWDFEPGARADTDSTVYKSDLGTTTNLTATWNTFVRGSGSSKGIAGPDTAPSGDGSLLLETPDDGTNPKINHLQRGLEGKTLSTIDHLKYSTYRQGRSTANPLQTAAMNVTIDQNGPNVTGGFATLVFEPYYQTNNAADIHEDEWQTWDAFNDGDAIWWSPQTIGSLPGSQSGTPSYVSWDQFVANAAPSAFVYAVGINQGGGNDGLFTAVDGLELGTAQKRISVDFEPVVAKPIDAVSVDVTETKGAHTVSWESDNADGTSYLLQVKDADDSDWSDVTTTTAVSHTFDETVAEGTRTYRVIAKGEADSAAVESESVKVDRTGPTTPLADVDRDPEYVSSLGLAYFKDTVSIGLSGSDDPTLPDGSAGVGGVEYDDGTTRSTGGIVGYSGKARDALGNESAASNSVKVRVDADAPTINVATCPTESVRTGSSTKVTVTGNDPGSGASGMVRSSYAKTLSHSTPGPASYTLSVSDNVGHVTTKDCNVLVTTQVSKAGAPRSSDAVNKGTFKVTWTAPTKVDDASDLRYELQHRPAAGGDYTTVASDLTGLTHAFTSAAREDEGTWRYRVIATDGHTSSISGVSSAVVADRSAPAKPTVTLDRPAEYTAGDGTAWHRDSVTLTISDSGDPALADGSAGSGLLPYVTSVTRTVNGKRALSYSLTDEAGNKSQTTTQNVAVDSVNPTITATCPTLPVNRGSVQYLRTSAADTNGSGLASPAKASTQLDTSTAGTFQVTGMAVDNVGHVTTATCSYTVK